MDRKSRKRKSVNLMAGETQPNIALPRWNACRLKAMCFFLGPSGKQQPLSSFERQ